MLNISEPLMIWSWRTKSTFEHASTAWLACRTELSGSCWPCNTCRKIRLVEYITSLLKDILCSSWSLSIWLFGDGCYLAWVGVFSLRGEYCTGLCWTSMLSTLQIAAFISQLNVRLVNSYFKPCKYDNQEGAYNDHIINQKLNIEDSCVERSFWAQPLGSKFIQPATSSSWVDSTSVTHR